MATVKDDEYSAFPLTVIRRQESDDSPDGRLLIRRCKKRHLESTMRRHRFVLVCSSIVVAAITMTLLLPSVPGANPNATRSSTITRKSSVRRRTPRRRWGFEESTSSTRQLTDIFEHILEHEDTQDDDFPSSEQIEAAEGNSWQNRPTLAWWTWIVTPLISGLVGFGTNWLALKMLFYPTDFKPSCCLYKRWEEQPLGLFGWQGILPTKAGKMAGLSVDIMVKELFSVRDIFSRLESRVAAEKMRPGFEIAMRGIVEELTEEYFENVWNLKGIKHQVEERSMEEFSGFVEGFMGDLMDNFDDCFDLREMVVAEMLAHPEMVSKMFMEVGKKELKFIERSGFYFGTIMGVAQAVVLWIFPVIWSLPIAGAVVGFATNWLALKIIFSPTDPYPICGGHVVLQGLFLKRQKEASSDFAAQVTEDVLHSENFWRYLLHGKKSERFREILRTHTDTFTDQIIGFAGPLVSIYLGKDGFKEMKEKVKVRTEEQIEDIIAYIHDYTDEAMDLENTIRDKLQQLSPQQFERVLHPAFEEDEIQLILVGAFLGAVAGGIQAVIYFFT